MLHQSITGHDPERSKRGVPIAFRRQKDEGPVEPYQLGEVGIDLHHGTPAIKLCTAEILEPGIGALQAIEEAARTVREWHFRLLHTQDCQFARTVTRL